jgi:type II secretory pathway pseudopilin PulG
VKENNMASRTARSSAFTLIELLVVIMIIVLLIGILLPAIAKARSAGRMTICMSHLEQMGVATHTYTADFQDKLFSFSVTQRSLDRLTYPALQSDAQGADDLGTAAAQAIDILWRRTGRDTGVDKLNLEGLIGAWIPNVLYTHLVLQDYLAQRLPEKLVVCPEDAPRLAWHDWHSFDANALMPLQPDASDPTNWRWPYSSSYQIAPASYAPDSARGGVSTVIQASDTNHFSLTPGKGDTLGKRKITDVMFTSNKIQMQEDMARHYVKTWTFYAYDSANFPALFFDQHARMVSSGEVLPGFHPENPVSAFGTAATYTPSAWDAPAGSPAAPILKSRWTRGGLQGVDVGLKEIDTTTWR